ncbi:MAG: penicillin acylase family protein [Anaerolineales bacterium]|nr:penicillin acylase family protein [Anaerolineales bacterium]
MTGNSITLIFLVLLLAAIVVAAVWLYVYWWLMQRPNPRLNGQVKAPFLEAPATVRRDKHGVPYITAANEADLFRVQGWTHAQDRLWQMEQARRTASGRLAEIFGAPALEADRFCRIIGYRRAAEAELATLDPATRQILDWYTEGVNAYINAHPGRLAAELNLLRARRAVDCGGYTCLCQKPGLGAKHQLAKRIDPAAIGDGLRSIHRV